MRRIRGRELKKIWKYLDAFDKGIYPWNETKEKIKELGFSINAKGETVNVIKHHRVAFSGNKNNWVFQENLIDPEMKYAKIELINYEGVKKISEKVFDSEKKMQLFLKGLAEGVNNDVHDVIEFDFKKDENIYNDGMSIGVRKVGYKILQKQ